MPRYSKKQKAALDALMREEVYRHAKEIIEADGVQGLTLDRLARAIGVSRGTLYNYFADRDAILEHVEQETFAPLVERLERVADGDARPTDKLRRIVRLILESVHENRALVVALIPEKHHGALREGQIRRQAWGLALLQRVVEQGIAAGEFRELPPRRVAEIVLGSLTGTIELMARNEQSPEPDEIAEPLLQILLGGLER
ncbi:MAG: TetR/AcrR family transcriptional regulator [Acidobacteriota bacterium]|nr:MAG: TetR/AcrR family transcriptional regulator [Acidobacteriota bacterium]